MTDTLTPRRVDWRKRKAETDGDPDDTLLAQTPADVVAVLGFDPQQETEPQTIGTEVATEEGTT